MNTLQSMLLSSKSSLMAKVFNLGLTYKIPNGIAKRFDKLSSESETKAGLCIF